MGLTVNRAQNTPLQGDAAPFYQGKAVRVADPVAWLATAREQAARAKWKYEAELLQAAETIELEKLSASDLVDLRRELSAGLVADSLSLEGFRLLGAAAQRRAEAGGESCITPPASSQGETVAGGFDWLELSVYIVWNPKAWKALRDRFQWAKVEAGEGRCGYLPHPEDGKPLPVSPDGRMHGPRGVGVYCPWAVDLWPGVSLHFADAPDHTAKGGRANAFVRITGIAFLTRGGLYWWRECKNLLVRLGAMIDKHVISRVDGCIDLVNVGVNEFVQPFIAGKCVKRARKWQINGEGVPENATGLSVGRGSRIIIYDKLAECKNDKEKFDLMVQRRWGGSVPKKATRIEFHLRNDDLREKWGISTCEELDAKAGALFTLLAESWFRITDAKPDRERKHQSRAKPSALWCRVIAAFREVFMFDGEHLDKPVKVIPDARRLRAQVAGCMSSALASLENDVENLEEIVGTFEGFMEWAIGFLSPSYAAIKEKCFQKLWEFRTTRISNATGGVEARSGVEVNQAANMPGSGAYG
jgi:hypothetical protein